MPNIAGRQSNDGDDTNTTPHQYCCLWQRIISLSLNCCRSLSRIDCGDIPQNNSFYNFLITTCFYTKTICRLWRELARLIIPQIGTFKRKSKWNLHLIATHQKKQQLLHSALSFVFVFTFICNMAVAFKLNTLSLPLHRTAVRFCCCLRSYD